MWILSSESTDSDGQASVEKLRSLVSARGGAVTQAELWGRRTMAFPIKGQREGAYYVARFSVESKSAPEIEHAVRSDQTVLRHVMVLADEVQAQPEPAVQPPVMAEQRTAAAP